MDWVTLFIDLMALVCHCFEGEKGYVLFIVAVFGLIVAIIIITSVWTLCFTRNFLRHQSQIILLVLVSISQRRNNYLEYLAQCL